MSQKTPPNTSSLRTLRARIAAFSLHAQRDPRETTKKAREVFLASFEDQVDPLHELPAVERQRRAEAARKAHFTRLSLASAKARRQRAAQGHQADADA